MQEFLYIDEEEHIDYDTSDEILLRVWNKKALDPFHLDQYLVREEIKKLAYYKWEEAGRPKGRDQEFWISAEKEVRGSLGLAKR